jgi:hypothetical protein
MEHNWSEQGVKELAQPEAVPPKGNRPIAPHADEVHRQESTLFSRSPPAALGQSNRISDAPETMSCDVIQSQKEREQVA